MKRDCPMTISPCHQRTGDALNTVITSGDECCAELLIAVFEVSRFETGCTPLCHHMCSTGKTGCSQSIWYKPPLVVLFHVLGGCILGKCSGKGGGGSIKLPNSNPKGRGWRAGCARSIVSLEACPFADFCGHQGDAPHPPPLRENITAQIPEAMTTPRMVQQRAVQILRNGTLIPLRLWRVDGRDTALVKTDKT